MMLFRFIAALVLIVAVSLSAIALEKRELALKRAISLQHFRMDQLMEERARLRIRLHKLSAARFSNGASSDNPNMRQIAELPESPAMKPMAIPLHRVDGRPRLDRDNRGSLP